MSKKDRTFDPTKPVIRRDGMPARIICTDVFDDGRKDGLCVLLMHSWFEKSYLYHKSGLHFGDMIYRAGMRYKEHPHDLINIEELKEDKEDAPISKP